jgi:hypothetical protein
VHNRQVRLRDVTDIDKGHLLDEVEIPPVLGDEDEPRFDRRSGDDRVSGFRGIIMALVLREQSFGSRNDTFSLVVDHRQRGDEGLEALSLVVELRL